MEQTKETLKRSRVYEKVSMYGEDQMNTDNMELFNHRSSGSGYNTSS